MPRRYSTTLPSHVAARAQLCPSDVRVRFGGVVEPLESRRLLSTYYVSPSGLDASAGTESAPWKTLSHGLTAVQAGDTLVLRAGTYPGGVTIDTPDLTVRNYPGERPIISAPTTDSGVEQALY